MQFVWRRSIRTLIGLALVVAWAPLGYAQSLPARLLAVSSASDPSTFVVLLETSEEVRYRTHQPDALSLIVELRNVTGRSADNRFIPSSTGPVRAVTIEERRESDDSFTTLVRLAIDRPLPYRVASAGSSLRIEFARMVDEDDMAGTGGDVSVPTGTLEAFPAADIATEITDIDTQRVAGGVTVTLCGNGRLLAGYIGPVAGSPPRLMLDFPNVTASVPSLLAPAAGPIDQIRVALNSRSPLVTRVVLDLAAEVDYETLPSESNGRDLRLLVRDVERAAPINLALAPTSGRDPTSGTIAIGDPRRIDPLSALAEPFGGIDAARERARVDDPGALLIRPEVPPASGPLTVAAPSGTTDTPATPPPAMSSAAFAGPEPSPLAAEPRERPERIVEPTPVDVAAVPMEPAAPVDAPARPESPVARVESPVASVESPVARIDPGAALASAPVPAPIAPAPFESTAIESAPIVSDAFEPLGAEPVSPVSGGVSPVFEEPSPVPVETMSQPVPSQVPTAAPLILGDASVGQPVPSDAGPLAPPAAASPVPVPPDQSPFQQGAPAAPAVAAAVPPVPAPAPSLGASAPAEPAAPAEQFSQTEVQPAESQYTGHMVSLDFQSADLRAVLRTFAEISGLNMVIDPTIEGSVDVALRDVPWDQALDIILRANKLGYSLDGSIVRIVPLRVMAEEEEERRRLADARALAGELRVITQTLSYARATDLAELLTRTVLSPRGSAQVDERTNTIILNDLADRLDTALELIGTLDRPEPQVEIEARIVQTTRDFARAIGVQWGVAGRMAQELGNTSGLVFPNTGSVSGRTGASQGPPGDRASGFDQSGTAVDLGVDAASTALGLALGSVNGAFSLDVVLSALERTGNGRVLSTPRVSTQNNIEAEVTQGIQIPIQTVANNTVTVTFKDAALTLRVTPQITSANTVIMRITLENASPDFTRSINGIPPIDTQRASTQVQVDDGATTVIGGIFISREQQVTDRTPFLHRIPLLGWLFKRDAVQDESRELLIFVTPRILR